MKQLTRRLIQCAALMALAWAAYLWLPPSTAGLQAVEQLKNVTTFSLGPVGPAGEIPDSVFQFLATLDSRHSSRLFRDLYENGTPEAKTYALCGLWLTNGGFDQYAVRYQQEVKDVFMLSSCFGTHRSPVEIVEAIQDCVIDHQLKLLRQVVLHAPPRPQ